MTDESNESTGSPDAGQPSAGPSPTGTPPEGSPEPQAAAPAPAETPSRPDAERRPQGPRGEGGRPPYDGGGPRGQDRGGGGGARPPRRRFVRRFHRRKVCRFCVAKMEYIDYKDARRLRRFMSDRGKILPRRVTGCCAKHQRMLTHAIKRARNLALLPYKAE